MIPSLQPNGLLAPGDYEVSFEELRLSGSCRRPASKHGRAVVGRQVAQATDRQPRNPHESALASGHSGDLCRWFVRRGQGLPERPRRLLRLRPPGVGLRGPGATAESARSIQGVDLGPSFEKARRGYPKKQLPMWHRYRVELYPHVPGLGLGSGILDKWGNELEFPSAFRQSRRDGTPRGIIKIKYGGLL